MKQIILFIASALMAIAATAQTQAAHKAADYEAANWKTWLLDNPAQITIAAAPSPAQSNAEIQAVKQAMSKMDEKKLSQIKYWNAGAPAYRWNQIAPDLIEQKPEILFRIPTAWINIAIYDATILTWKEKLKYKRKHPQETDASIKPVIDAPLTYSYPCEYSATAAAAATMLAYFFPEKADSILQLAHNASQSRIDAGVAFPSDVDAGWKLGEQVAKQIIEKAKNDGSAKEWDGTMNKDPKKWTGAYPVGISLGKCSTIILRSPDQFRPPPPPDFENDMKELKNFKQTFQSSSLAYYWANNGGLGFWSDKAAIKMFEYHIMDDAPAVARIYAILHSAYHDAAIAIFDAKYTYWGIRPNQYDTTYKSLIPMPPFPGYPSGHATGAATTSAVLGYFFPDDAKEFQKLAADCAESRFDGGIHFRTDNNTGLKMGKEIGEYVVETWMKK